jgi:hypothetical protein
MLRIAHNHSNGVLREGKRPSWALSSATATFASSIS